jgi:putative MATE family efflux protein
VGLLSATPMAKLTPHDSIHPVPAVAMQVDAEAAGADMTTEVTPRPQELTSAPPTARSVLRLAWPVIVEQFLQASIGLANTWIAGHIPGDEATVTAAAAAVGTIAYLQWLTGLMTNALGVGATAIVARRVGAGRIRSAKRTAGIAIAWAFLLGLAMSCVMYVFAEPICRFMGLKDLPLVFGVQYLKIIVFTLCFQAVANIGMATMRGAGNTVSPMIVAGIITVVNFLASASLTFGWGPFPALGLRGNALGDLLVYLCAGVATIVMLTRPSYTLALQRRHIRFSLTPLRRILSIGIPSWLEGALLWLGQSLILIFVINQGDLNGIMMAAHNSVIRIEALAFLPGFGFGMAASALVGQYLGKKRPDAARQAAFLSLRLALITMTLAALPMILFPTLLLRLMVTSDIVAEVGYWPMILAGLAQPSFAIAIVMAGSLRGAGATKWPLWFSTGGIFLFRIPLLFLCLWLLAMWTGHPLDQKGKMLCVWIAIFADLNLRGVGLWLAFSRSDWAKTKV